MITLNVGLLLQIITLLVFLVLIRKLALQRLQRVLETRRERLHADERRRDEAARQAAGLEAERRQVLDAARHRGREAGHRELEESRRSGAAAIERATAEESASLEQTQQRLEAEIQSARESLSTQLDDLAARLSDRLLLRRES